MTAPARNEALIEAVDALGLALNDATLQAVEVHLTLLRKWAPKVNLVSKGDLASAESRHAADALSLLRLASLRQASGRLIDVGSGAGFPGVPIAAARRDLDITLLEPRQKRGAFLTQVLRQAGLTHARWRPGRLPEPSLNGQFDVVVSRATFPPEALVERVAPLLTPHGIIILMTSQEPAPDPLAHVVERDMVILRGQERHLTVVKASH